ncbi:putative outer membrane protein [Devosia sp. LC5]|uniref:porin n=1 Tax=Devosia sp. LC5 TaxID=1502724 RepID=UPI0004E30488|nr:porin [Devosia sp. LC5]KFC71112.1 putative outer membrane protein [Devosia sp. LC5]
MKLKSLILGSIAAAGLSTAGYAADLGVLTSLDVCDSLGISGLTISSDTNCLQISGGVKYEFYWGDYKDEPIVGLVGPTDDIVNFGGPINFIGAGSGPDGELDWRTKSTAWLKFVGSSDSDFGTAKAVLKLNFQERWDVQNEADYEAHGDNGLVIDEAYVSVGDSTVLMAGKKSTIGNFGDSQPFNFLRTFGYNEVDNGILLEGDEDGFGGHVIQIVSDLGNGVSVGVGLENLEGQTIGPWTEVESTGTLVGVVSYAGENVTAHLTGFAGGIIDGTTEFYGLHAGATGTFDMFKVRAALGYVQNEVLDDSKLHALISAEAGFDMFTVALSGEYVDTYGLEGYGVAGSIGATITDGIKINLGSRWFHSDTLDVDTVQVAAQLIAAVTETIEVTGEVGGYFGNGVELGAGVDSVGYGALGVKWAPGGGFTSSLKGELTTESAYKVSFTAEKTFD